MNKRMLLAEFCDRTGATELLFAFNRRTKARQLSVLTFHRVADIGPGYPFDDGVVDTSPSEFDRQLAIIRKHLNPVTLGEVRAFVETGAPLPTNPVLVTFDDGYLDNYTVALPLLRRHGIPATFFIASDYLTRRRMFWWDRIAYTIKASRRSTLSLMTPKPLELDIATPDAKAKSLRRVLRLVKTTYGLDLERFLDEVACAAAIPWSDEIERRLANELLMTWDHVRVLAAEGMEIQSHTRTHRVLQTLRPEELVEELDGSRADLERELGRPIYAVSYPAGHGIDGRPDGIRSALARAGYQLGFTNAAGAQSLRGAIDRYNVKRIALDAHTPEPLFRAMLAMPAVFDRA